MDENASLLCRLCLKPCVEYEVMEEIHQDVFRTILLTLNLDISHEPVICKGCIDNVQKCFNYATSMSIKETFNGVTGCLFCIQWVATDPFVLLNYQQLDVMLFKAMLEQFFPELDLKFLDNPFVCLDCYESLQKNFDFMVSCLNVEQQIKNYSESTGTDGNGHVDLKQVVNYATVLKGLDIAETDSCKETDTPQPTINGSHFTENVTDEDIFYIKTEIEEEIIIPECASMEDILEENASKELINVEPMYTNEEIGAETVKEELTIKEESFTINYIVNMKSEYCTADIAVEAQSTNLVGNKVEKNSKEGKVFKPRGRRKCFKNGPTRSKSDNVGEIWGNIARCTRNR